MNLGTLLTSDLARSAPPSSCFRHNVPESNGLPGYHQPTVEKEKKTMNGRNAIVKFVAMLFGMGLANAAFAVIPAATELPIAATGLQKFVPGEDRPVVFRIDRSEAKTAAGDASRRLAGCTLEGTAHLEAKNQRITIKNARIKCPAETKATKKMPVGPIEGQILGLDRKTGLRVTCKYQPGCHLGTLRDGDTGFFLISKPFGG